MTDAPENPPGFVVRTEAPKVAWDNGYRLERGVDGGWLQYASTTAPGAVWIAGASPHGPWLLSIGHSGVAAELGALPVSSAGGPGLADFLFATLSQLHATLDRVHKLAISLPNSASFSTAIAAMRASKDSPKLEAVPRAHARTAPGRRETLTHYFPVWIFSGQEFPAFDVGPVQFAPPG